MKTILATAATAGIALGAPAFAFEPESDQTIKLMQAGFTEVMDTEAMFRKCFAEMQEKGLLPPP